MLQNPMYVTHSWTVLTSDCLGMFQCGAIVQTAILVKVYFLNEFLQEKNPAYEGKMIILYIFNRNHFPPPPLHEQILEIYQFQPKANDCKIFWATFGIIWGS